MVNPATALTGRGRRRLTIAAAATVLVPAALGIYVAVTAALISIPASAAATSGHTAPAGSPGATGSSPAVAYSVAVTQICGGALLFDNAHQMGTRSDALSIADDIQASTARRLDRVKAVSVPSELRNIDGRWIDSQRRLAALYARIWVRIYDTIDATRTPAQRARLPKRLEKLIHAPDTLKATARQLELDLHVPDCTRGG
jgi:hypothetical protein